MNFIDYSSESQTVCRGTLVCRERFQVFRERNLKFDILFQEFRSDWALRVLLLRLTKTIACVKQSMPWPRGFICSRLAPAGSRATRDQRLLAMLLKYKTNND